MKTFLKIAGGILVIFLAVLIALNLYFTDERLKSTVMPHLNEAMGREVQVESMSLTFFSTFPQPGLSITKMSIPGAAAGDTLASLDELVVGVELSSLWSDEIGISQVRLNGPRFTYRVYADSTTNIDFLTAAAEEDTAAPGLAVSIPYFKVNNARFGYVDETSDTEVRLNNMDADISLRYADLIESTVDMQLGGLYAAVAGTRYVNDLPLRLTETSTIDLKQEVMNLKKGTLSLRGLDLNLSGTISEWSSTPKLDLAFSSSSDNFGELLRLVPADYEQYVDGLETRGVLDIEGSVKGTAGGESPLSFAAAVKVANGYLKNPDLPKPIEDIQINAEVTNEMLTVSTFTAKAGDNSITAGGRLANPLADEGSFSVEASGNVDLATVQSFYDISRFKVDRMQGKLDFKGDASGQRSKPEEASFNASLRLAGGLLQYRDVPKAIENINIDARATDEQLTINSMQLEAAANTFSLQGTVGTPLEETRTVDLDGSLAFDLATIKEFYPISEDTLRMAGKLTAQATLKGKADRIEKTVQSGSINLKDGLIDYKRIGQPIRDITFESVLDGPQMTVVTARFQTGDNNMEASGVVNNYLSDSRTVNLKLEGSAQLSEIDNYYKLEPAISKLTGTAKLNLRTEGQPDKPAGMTFNGGLEISGMTMEGDSLAQPIRNLNGTLSLSPAAAMLENLRFNFGSSDMSLDGSLRDYTEYFNSRENRKATPHLTGSYRSKYLNVDEIIDWEDTTDTPIPIHLPNLNSSVTASVDKMLLTGVTIQNLQARAGTTPTQIKMDQASAELFEGKANGSLVWEVPRPERTMISFNGTLNDLRAEAFFEEYQVLGAKSQFHKYVSGAFSANVDYYSELDVYLTPVVATTKAEGSFGMTKARLKGHPFQEALADMLSARELRNVALDEWKSTFTISNSVLTFKDLRLTSGNIGVEMNGSQHLVKETIDYQMKLYLPDRFRKAIASIITEQAVKALEQENGTIMLPMRLTGTMDKPNISPDQAVIKPILQKYLKDKAGNVLKKLFDG